MIQKLDFAILDWIQLHLKCGALDFLMPKATLLAEDGIFLIVLGLLFLLMKSRRVIGMEILTGMGIGLLCGNLILKNLIARPRPCWLNPDVVLLIQNPTDFSMPSAHTMHCFIVATVLMHHDRRAGVPAVVLASLVGFSRLYLYVHFPTDVLFGALLGIGIGILTIKLFRRRNKPDEETVSLSD